MDIGKRLREIREEKKITIYKLSKDTGISQNHISGIELNKRQPTIDTLSRLLAPLGVTLAELFNEGGEAVYPTDREKALLEGFRCLSEDKAEMLLKICEMMK